MKLNATPLHYMPLSQTQSDDDDPGPSKENKSDKLTFKNSFSAADVLTIKCKQTELIVDPGDLPMTTSRRIAFILSLILCVLFVVTFVYVVPCSMHVNLDSACHLTHRWKIVLHNMSFTSTLDFIDSRTVENQLIIIGYKNDEFGIIAIDESNGREQWRLHLHSVPLSTLCNVIDANSDGTPECLVIGKNGLFAAIDIRKGISLWYLHNHSNLNSANSIDGPIIIPDQDGDNIEDIIISYNISGEKTTSYLALVSGGTGEIVGSLIELSQCIGPVSSRFLWKFHNNTYLVFYCTGEKSGNLWLLSSKDIDVSSNVTEKVALKNLYRIPHFVENIQFYKPSTSEIHLVIILDGSKLLMLEWSLDNNFNLKWNINIPTDQHARIVADGNFIKGSMQIAIASTSMHKSKVSGISFRDGREMWSISYENKTVTSAIKLKNFFGTEDGLILKVLSYATFYDPSVFHEHFVSSFAKTNFYGKYLPAEDAHFLEENYILVKCGKYPVEKIINSERVLVSCKGGVCQPNVHSTNSTALIKMSKLGTSFDMLMVTPTIFPTSSSIEEIIIKYLNLEMSPLHSSCHV